MQRHRVARRVVQDASQVVEARHQMEPAGQVVEERTQVPVRDDRFRNRQQGSVLLAGGKLLAVSFGVTHDSRHSELPTRASYGKSNPWARGQAIDFG